MVTVGVFLVNGIIPGKRLSHVNVWESMGKPCSCLQFIKSRILYYKSRENPYQVLQVTCASSEHAMRGVHIYDKIIITIVPSLVPRHQIFRARPAALSKNRVWTRSLVKLGRNHTSVLACCRTNQIVQVK